VRRGIFGGLGLVIIVAIGIALYLSVFIVDQTQQALVLRFGETVRKIDTPGLYYKLPLIDNVVEIDKRILDLDSPPLEIIASDQKRLVVDAFGRYRIIDPLLFYQSVGTVQGAESRLSVVLNSAVRRVLGDADFISVVRDRRAALMAQIKDQVDREATALGLKIIDVKIRHADLPAANSQAIYQRMQTERQRKAAQARAAGEQEARRIRAEADRCVTVLVAEATGESERLRGKGEAERNSILAGAFGKDPSFFAFYRSMQAYQTSLKGPGTRVILSPDSDFFRYFNDPDAKPGASLPSPEGAPAAAVSAGGAPPAKPAEATPPAPAEVAPAVSAEAGAPAKVAQPGSPPLPSACVTDASVPALVPAPGPQ
jgi:membrane protease subunit HflC